MDAAQRRRAFPRALRVSGSLELSEADARTIEQHRQRNKG
jgi:hypothetical protein